MRQAAADWLNEQIEGLKRVFYHRKGGRRFSRRQQSHCVVKLTVNDQQISDLNNKLIEARAKTAEAHAKYDQASRIATSGGDAGG